MAQVPKDVQIGLKELNELLNFYWVAVNSEDIGDLGQKTYEDLLIEVDRKSNLKVTPLQLETLIYHMKQVVFEKLRPLKYDSRIKNYQGIMKLLQDQIPQLFKELPSGEISFIELGEQHYDESN